MPKKHRETNEKRKCHKRNVKKYKIKVDKKIQHIYNKRTTTNKMYRRGL